MVMWLVILQPPGGKCNMNEWTLIAQRIVAGLNVQPGELIQVRDHCDRPDVLQEVLLAVDRVGATPVIDHQSPAYLERWLATATPGAIAQSGRHRVRWLETVDRVVSLSGGLPDFARTSPDARAAWEALAAQITAVEEERQLPVLVVAVPNPVRAARLGMTLPALEAHLLPALRCEPEASRSLIAATRGAAAGDPIVLTTGEGDELHLYRGDRTWHRDDGVIDEDDRRRKSVVSNLPAGSLYTTVLEDRTHGRLFLPEAPGAQAVTLTFAAGRIVHITAVSGADALAAWLDSHDGEPRRVSHIGIGLNPHLRRPIGWTLVDEHIAGAVFLALGENRYMGGQNASALNHDFALFGATLHVAAQPIVVCGELRSQASPSLPLAPGLPTACSQ